ncbi:DUF4124 domain-containing protein [Shewanella intestini]|uniref:DUF4124 domain-containing protein n=1 Tax=Shewanella intestini TaxID=2017544 RepID=A0ABS5I2T9_9GAMM|nr:MULTISPECIES: DUF4124 domain-containing protein [Shewanella]MBR9727720.1 DUF4124 domain-containing protein [Shewanella intestini]MRG35130.1 DUF4124 domain-containing protein [Shewanella sp. XMDDZSB0408]
MARNLFFIVLLSLPVFAQAENSTIYKCMKNNKVVFSHTICPEEFRQHKIEYQLGITTETDSDKKKVSNDPLKALLKKQTISKDKLLQLLASEVYRLKQENSYFEILRASEIQKLDRKHYWQTKPKDDPSYGLELQAIHQRFDDLTTNNLNVIQMLNQHKMKITAEVSPDHFMSQ